VFEIANERHRDDDETPDRQCSEMRAVRLVQALVLGLIVIGCAGSTSSSSGSSPTLVGPSQASASPVSEPSPVTSPSGSAAATYTTVKFGVPLTVTVAAGLASPPTDDNRVRFLVPAEVHPPDAARPMPPPTDFPGYIKGLADRGGLYSNMTMTTVDGVQATLLTAKSSRSLDGSLGCQTIGADRAEGCFGLQPEFALRLARLT
jgi:hypothetical protein